MKTSKFTDEQIAFALRQAETGTKVAEVCRKIGISDGWGSGLEMLLLSGRIYFSNKEPRKNLLQQMALRDTALFPSSIFKCKNRGFDKWVQAYGQKIK